MRLLGALIVILAVAAATVFFADHPGRVEVLWQGWQIDTSVGVLIALAALAALAVALVLWLLWLMIGAPRTFLRRRRERRRRAGYDALTRGMIAIAAGESGEAQRYARRAAALLAEPLLTLLLSAQAAQIGGDDLAAKKFFTAMLDRRETEFLGLRGLFNQATRAGDPIAARELAERGAVLRPNSGWAVAGLFDLDARDARWTAARETLDKAARHRLMAPERVSHHRGVILYELSLAAEAEREHRRALALADEAQTQAPELAPLATHHARLLLANGRTGRAARVIERAWGTAPHPQLAQAYAEIDKDETALARVARFGRLAAQNPSSRESHLAVAEAALAAQLWGEARRHLEEAMAAPPPSPPALPGAPWASSAPPTFADKADAAGWVTPRLCLLMARLEEAEHGDTARMRQWLDFAAQAPPDPRYVCGQCAGESGEWSSLCPRCGAFDTLGWKTPPSTGAGLLPLAAPKGTTVAELAGSPLPALPSVNAADG